MREGWCECAGPYRQAQELLFRNSVNARRHPAIIKRPLSPAAQRLQTHIPHTHLLTVILCEFIQQPCPLLPSQVSQKGGQDGTDMF